VLCNFLGDLCGQELFVSELEHPTLSPLTPTLPRGRLKPMVVTCPQGMNIPAGPVSKQIPVLSTPFPIPEYLPIHQRLAENTE
jgi:hypothetical protein